MYTEHFGLTEAPFSIAPNPQYLFMSRRHRDALAHLLYGVQSDGGFILLTGEVGTGKTTLCRCLLEQVPDNVETAFVLNPRVSATELVATICDEFGIHYPPDASLKTLVDHLNTYLLDSHSNHKKAVLIIDEAQNLSYELLEQLRLLTNLETNERKLLQILLLGQPELLDMLEDRSLRQFSQRITARFHLDALDASETEAYIIHRLAVAHGDPGLFTRAAMRKVHRISAGIPRVTNLICDRALLGAYAEHRKQVTPRIISKAATEVLGARRRGRRPATTTLAMAAAASIAVVVTAGVLILSTPDSPVTSISGQPATINLPVSPSSMVPVLPLPIKGHVVLSQAYHDLFALWGTAFEDKTSNPCGLAEAIGLGCLESTATFAELKNLNRPVIVQLNDQYFTLSRVLGDAVTVIAGSNQFELTTASFESNYRGIARMLWRMPPDYHAPLRKNDQGAAVDWLVVQLAMIEGQTPPLQTGFIFTDALEARVRDFQASVGLLPNGIVGPFTWIHLNDTEAMSIPTLRPQAVSNFLSQSQSNHQG